MAKGKIYTGITIDSNTIKVAVVSVSNKKLRLIKLDKFTLIKPIEKVSTTESDEDVFEDLNLQLSDDSVFDLNLDSPLEDELLEDNFELDEDILGDLDKEDDIDLELNELEQADEELIDIDMVDETEVPTTNEMLLYNILSSIDHKKANIGLNIPAGVAIYQILKDVNFSEVKKKDLKIIIDDRLESLYGSIKADDFYSYGIRNDGALLISSIDEEPSLLQLVNRTLNFYKGKLTVEEILPDETLLLGLVRANYALDEEVVSCLIQISDTNCRVIFLKGSHLWLVSPMITEGASSKKFLNTVFSKILFQLDTGEVPNLDRIIICNNSMGETATSFFQERFPDLEVSNFQFSEDFLDPGDYTSDSLTAFTTSIGMGWATSKFNRKHLPNISFVPKYVSDRQKIFRLQWHGFLLLFLIMISFPVLDSVRKKGNIQIESIRNQISLVDNQANSFTSTVNNYNRISNELSQIQTKLELMNTLAENSITWSTNLDLINEGIKNINSIWITSLSVGEDLNTLEIQGISRYRNRIPEIAELFADATLLDVTRFEIREQEVYRFSYQINKIVPNTSVYTPNNLKGLGDLTGN